MEIILHEKIQNLGEVGDIVSVKNGYARNFLIPQKKASVASAKAKAEMAEKREQLLAEEAARVKTATQRADKAPRELVIRQSATEEGHLYGSVSPAEIAAAMAESGSDVEKAEVFQPEGPIKETGDFVAEIILHPEVRFEVAVKVVAED